jgi:hypothetical protein
MGKGGWLAIPATASSTARAGLGYCGNGDSDAGGMLQYQLRMMVMNER